MTKLKHASRKTAIHRLWLNSVAVLALTGSVGFLGSSSSHAESLQEALVSTYNTNPTLLAARDALRAVDEQVPQALSNYRPDLSGTTSAGLQRSRTRTSTNGDTTQNTQPLSVALNISQSLYRGGRTEAQVEQAENTVLAQRATLRSVEQSVFQSAVSAYADVWRDEAVLRLNISNERVLARQLEAVQDRFEVGELTRTDVAQAESRLAQAVATRVAAEGDLKSSAATYEQIIGMPYTVVEQPFPFGQLPGNLEGLLNEADSNNPGVVAARFTEQAARDTIRLVKGELYPEVSLNGSVAYNDEQSSRDTDVTSGAVTAQVTIPLYQQGVVYSRVREAKHTANQRLIEVREQELAVRESAISSWEQLVSTRAQLQSLQTAVSAAEVALEGVRQEEEVGQRTILDVLDAEQELLDASVDLVVAQRDEVVATYNVLAASGKLSADFIGLNADLYDPSQNYNAVRDRWFGTDIQ
ncbi:TolC family outer membrane protein [Kiloniella sp. b19]|uniref:TolC family outer membrane protein n=1 Tax=Kiloniella sp. GXU_MW_B19 TaxID=3141326 RepID=UPI0031DDE33F